MRAYAKLLGLAGVAVMVSSAWAAPTAQEVIEKMGTKIGQVKTYQADTKMTGEIPDGKINGQVHYAMARVKQGDKEIRKTCTKMTMKKEGDENTAEMKMVDDGEFLWMEMKMKNPEQIMVMKNKSGNIQGPGRMTDVSEQMNMFRKLYVLKLTGEDSIEGKKVYVLEGGFNPEAKDTPKTQDLQENAASIKIFVGEEDLALRRMITTGKDGKQTIQMDVTNIKMNEEIEPATFVYTPPAGTRVMDMTKMRDAE